MGQPAYDMSSEVRRRKAPQTQRKVALRVEKGGKRRLSPFQAAMQHALQLISMALLAGFAVSLLWSEAQLVEVNDQIQKAKAELVSEQSQYTYYNSVLNSKTNITSVEEVAGRLGLMKMDQSQLTYIRLDSDSGAQGVGCPPVDGFPARRCHDHSGFRPQRKISKQTEKRAAAHAFLVSAGEYHAKQALQRPA